MIYEVAAAVDHVVSLVQEIERIAPIAPAALAGFASTLKDALEKRCQRCWKPTEPECGSAQRSVAWQLHASGEGADQDLLRAFASVVEAHAEEGEIVHPSQSKVVDLALEWLPISFTLWIDPGCVAIRRGSGPGANRSFYDFDLQKSGSTSSAIHVVWGQMVAHTADRHAPQLTVSSAPRPIAIVPPTAVQSRYPVQTMSNRGPLASTHRHQRTASTSSSASSSCGGLVRSVSLSSTHSASTAATSVDAESESYGSLRSPFSSIASAHCTPSKDNDRESVHDTTIGDTTERFAGTRLFDDDEQDEDAGDETLGATPMLGLNVAQQVAPAAPKAPVKCNYTTHDNGNVGVLGGGVRLGGGSVKTANSQPPRHRQHSVSKSISHLQNGLHNQLLPPYMPRHQQPVLAHQIPRQLHHHMNAPNFSAPMRTVPLPPVQQYHQHPQQYLVPQQQRAAMQPFAQTHPSQYGYHAPAPQHQPHFAPQHAAMPSALHLEVSACAEDDDADKASSTSGRRRIRSRGRRSRGRGAGRAARRQAAALRSLELGSTDELPEFDDDEFDDGDSISRCSTPATSSEYTDSSCYSSATSSPAKSVVRSGRLSNRSSRSNLKAADGMALFGMQLHSGLARLQAQM